jgi:hypothetical protein
MIKEIVSRPPLNLIPIGPAHVYHQWEYPTSRVPFDGWYTVGYNEPQFIKGRKVRTYR